MPKYSFECQQSHCELHFSRTLKMGEWPTHPCPSCKEEAPRKFDSFGFAFQTPEGKETANTGVHDHDYPSADKVVGRSAETRWESFRKRQAVKNEVRKMSGTNALVRVDGQNYVEYDGMTDASQKARAKTVDYAVALEKRPVASSDR